MQKRHPRKRAQQPAARPGQPLQVKWSRLGPLVDTRGKPFKRFYQLDTLASAIERLLQTSGNFIQRTLSSEFGPDPVIACAFELFREGRNDLVFRLNVTNTKRSRATLALVVAKNHEECSAIAQTQHQHLQLLYERAPQFVVKPLHGGTLFLPDRHRRVTHGRELYAYVTQWLPSYEVLHVNHRLQCTLGVRPAHTCTKAETETVRAQIVSMAAAAYHPRKRHAIDLAAQRPGSLVARRSPTGGVKLKLTACRKLLTLATPARLLDHILGASWNWTSPPFGLVPADPESFFDALGKGAGPQAARQWIGQYFDHVEAGKLPKRKPAYLEALRQLVLK